MPKLFAPFSRWSVTFLLVLALALTACGQAAQPEGSAPAQPDQAAQPSEPAPSDTGPDAGGKLTVAIQPGLIHIDPSTSNSRYVHEATLYVYERLFERDADGKVVPWLVENYEVSSDGLTVTFHLQRGVTFHDGTPFTSEVVKWNLERKHGEKLTLGWLLDVVESIEIVDDHTLVLHLEHPNAALPSNLAAGTFAMMNPVFVDQVGSDAVKTSASGTGPYILEGFQAQEFVRLRRNPDYWQEGLPHFDEIELLVIPDVATRATMLEAGDVDLVVNLSDADSTRFQNTPGLEVLSTEAAEQNYMVINNLRWTDKRVRQAFNYAIDKESMVQSVFLGVGAAVAQGPILGPSVEGFHPVGSYPYDPAKAAQLLEEAGWLLNAAGQREKDGQVMRLDMFTRSGAGKGDIEIAEIVQAQLGDVGVDVNVMVMDPGDFSDGTAVPPDEAEYDLVNLVWGTFSCDAEYTLNYMMRADGWPPALRNRMYYNNPRIDELLDLGNVQSVEERNRYYAQAQEQIFEDAPIIQLFQTQLTVAYKSDIHGVVIDPCQIVHPGKFAWRE